ncbi:MAG TPA: pentapeptide repeat-containing protein [Chloroflexota bacterium]
MDLKQLAETYLVAEGYSVTQSGRDLLVGNRQSLGEDVEQIYVWVPDFDSAASFRSLQGPYLARFETASKVHPHARKFFLVPSLEGITTDFRRTALSIWNVLVRVPAQFFDTAFRWEDSEAVRTAANEMRRRGAALLTRRVEQPFRKNDETAGIDLLETLAQDLGFPSASTKPIHIVIGPAGMGKTHLVEALFARLYSSFLKSKQALQVAARPLPLLPGYHQFPGSPTVESLLHSYLGSEFVRPLPQPVFNWMVANGFALWTLDGLDEVIARDPGFFDLLLDLLTTPGSQGKPRVLICVRDSLLATHQELSEFCEEHSDSVDVWRLEKWSKAGKRQYASIVMGSREREFLELLGSNERLDRLASTPYYCALLGEEVISSGTPPAGSEVNLIQRSLDRMITREYEKEPPILDETLIPATEVVEFARAVAAEDMDTSFQGVAIDVVHELASVSVRDDIPTADRPRLVSQMSQLPFFTTGTFGQIQFAQEVLEHYLLGDWLGSSLEAREFVAKMSVARIPADWITIEVIANRVRAVGLDSILPVIRDPATPMIAFGNMLQVAAVAAEQPGALKGVPFQHKDLSGVVFRKLDLAGVSFRGANLSDVEFDDCRLEQATFEGALIKNTGFLCADDALRGATVGDLAKFYSMRVPSGRVLDDRREVAHWFQRQTQIQPPIIEPCNAALQLRHLFGKFVYPDGGPRRSILDERGVLAGKRFADPEGILEAAVQYGYLRREEHFRHRVSRPQGHQYSELVKYATELSPDPGIRALLDEVCPTRGCLHIPPAGLAQA